jgi:hypothetical protein
MRGALARAAVAGAAALSLGAVCGTAGAVQWGNIGYDEALSLGPAPPASVGTVPMRIAISEDGSSVFTAVQPSNGASGRIIARSVTPSATQVDSLGVPASWTGIAGIAVGDLQDQSWTPRRFGWAVSSGVPAQVMQFEVLGTGALRQSGPPVTLSDALGAAASVALIPNSAKPSVRSLMVGMQGGMPWVLRLNVSAGAGVNPNPAKVLLDLPGGTISALGASPDGRYVAVAATDASGTVLQRFATDSLAPIGSPATIARTDPARAVMIGPDDRTAYASFATGSSDGQRAVVVRADLDTGSVGTFSALDLGGFGLPSEPLGLANGGSSLTPGGEEVLTAAVSGRWGVKTVFDTASSEQRPLSMAPCGSATTLITGQVAIDSTGVFGYVPRTCAGAGPRDASWASVLRVRLAEMSTLRVGIPGGGGVVDSSLGGTVCAPWADCTMTFRRRDPVTLTARPNPGWVFTGWSGGGCTGTDDDCTVSMGVDRTTTATFARALPVQLTVSIGASPNGATRVVSVPAGIDCTLWAGTCSASFRRGTAVALTATDPDGTVRAWTGACAGRGATCAVTLTGDTTAGVDIAAGRPDAPAPRPPDPAPPTPPDPVTPPTPTPAPTPAPAPVPVAGPTSPSNDTTPNPTPQVTPVGPLALSSFRVARSAFRAGQGTMLRYRLSRQARMRMTFFNRAEPKRVYTYAIAAGKPGADGGQNAVFISGRVRGRSVRPGRWVMKVTALDGATSTRTITRQLTLRTN